MRDRAEQRYESEVDNARVAAFDRQAKEINCAGYCGELLTEDRLFIDLEADKEVGPLCQECFDRMELNEGY